MKQLPLPGAVWRILAHPTDRLGGMCGPAISQQFDGSENVVFDELVISGAKHCWFHLEQMSRDVWWLGIGGPLGLPYLHVTLRVDWAGQLRWITVEEQNGVQPSVERRQDQFWKWGGR